MSGKYDYLLQAVVSDMDAFHQIAMHRIRTIGNIKEIKRSTTIPL